EDLLPPPPPHAASIRASRGRTERSRSRTAADHSRRSSAAFDSLDLAALSPRLDHKVVTAGLEEHQLGDVDLEQVVRRGRGGPGLALESAVELLERLVVADLHCPARDTGVTVGHLLVLSGVVQREPR